MTWTVLVGIYGEYGMKFEEATRELDKAINGMPASEPAAQKAISQDNERSMAMLQAMMGDADFRGPRG